ncbi:MAG: cytochrome c-type biogenesis CcmF C-terminal domain-containing protein, partial [Armatimonadota bacterium]|nr:cytochrome c-type biogenesis CcmF C-terminal domain-containing protein [Armatimonadota bacterium]
GMALYVLLLAGVVLSLAAPGILLATRLREVKTEATYDDPLSRDFTFFMGTVVLCLSAAMVLVGTSAPIVSSALVSLKVLQQPSSLQASFYNRTHYPVALLVGLLIAAAPLLSWRGTPPGVAARRLAPHAAVGVAGMAIAVAVGATDPYMLLLIGVSVLCVSVSAAALVQRVKESPLHAGAPLGHLGLACLLLGIVGSSFYSRVQRLTLRAGEAGEALGYQVAFHGVERPDDTRRELKLTLSRDAFRFEARPTMVFSAQMNEWVHAPAVRKFWLYDVYVSPAELRENDDPGTGKAFLAKGEALEQGGYTFRFERFDMSGTMGGQDMTVGAVLRVTSPNGRNVTVIPRVAVTEHGFHPTPVVVPGTGVTVALLSLAVPRIELAVTGLPGASGDAPREEAVVEVSTKPLINLVWLGTLLILAGGSVATLRRARETARLTGSGPAASPSTPAGNDGRLARAGKSTGARPRSTP